MSKKKELPEHTRLAPSASDRIISCPGSVALIKKHNLKTVESSYADEGTLAHELASVVLKNNWAPNTFFYLRNKIPGINKVSSSFEMSSHIDEYCQYVLQLRNAVGRSHHKARRIFDVEKRVEALKLHPEMHGTSDVIVGADGGPLHVIDLKYGAGVAVTPIRNTQALCYAFYVMQEYASYKFKDIYIHIFQPRTPSGKPLKIWKVTPSYVLKFGKFWHGAILRAERGTMEFREGKYCWFCPVSKAGLCPIQKKKLDQKAMELFEDESEGIF